MCAKKSIINVRHLTNKLSLKSRCQIEKFSISLIGVENLFPVPLCLRILYEVRLKSVHK